MSALTSTYEQFIIPPSLARESELEKAYLELVEYRYTDGMFMADANKRKIMLWRIGCLEGELEEVRRVNGEREKEEKMVKKERRKKTKTVKKEEGKRDGEEQRCAWWVDESKIAGWEQEKARFRSWMQEKGIVVGRV